MNSWSVIYEYCYDHPGCADESCQKTVVVHSFAVPEIDLRTSVHAKSVTVKSKLSLVQMAGLMIMALGIGGFFGPMIPELRMEASYRLAQMNLFGKAPAKETFGQVLSKTTSAPLAFNPLKTPDGASIDPVNTEFSLIVPSIGINAPVVANVDPSDRSQYAEALTNGIAHASTSFLPDQNGTVYLFSHDTNYDWFVKDLNAVFYLLKNVKNGDLAVIMYKGKRYTYKVVNKKVVSSRSTQYLFPTVGQKSLILETCWPPGSTAERLLIFADLIEDGGKII